MYTAADVHELVKQLNTYRNAYYNNDESLVSDKEYDQLFDKLVMMEKETGIILSNSPTCTVGYPVVSALKQITHDLPPMLSLDKSKEITKMYQFIGGKPGLVMGKMDGLTCRLTYIDGILTRAETRGDGYTGEDVTHNIRTVADVPMNVDKTRFPGKVIVDGEVIITRKNFEAIKTLFVDNKGKTYKNPRNFASGSIRLHNSNECAKRRLQFVAWKFVQGSMCEDFVDRLTQLSILGFNVTPYYEIEGSESENILKSYTERIEELCSNHSYPIDGCVFSYRDCKLMNELGTTSHHSKSQIAFKFYDEKYETTVRSIDWTMGKTGVLTPTAIFDPVEIDGTDVKRASLHNLTIMKELNVQKGSIVSVFKANMIIPQIHEVLSQGEENFIIPDKCPICNGETEVVCDNDSEILMCTNSNCSGKLLGKLCTFVSKQGMDIDGLGENSLRLFIQLGFIKSLSDVYEISKNFCTIKQLEGWGETSILNLLTAIDNSKNVTLDRFLTALSIPNIGGASAKTICDYFEYDVNNLIEAFNSKFDWSNIEGFGEKTSNDINRWYSQNWEEVRHLLHIVNIKDPVKKKSVVTDSPVSGKTFCVTGTFNWGKREEIKTKLEELGGIFVDSVTKKTEILFAGDKAGSKLKKAQDLNIIIYDESKLIELLEEN